MPKILVLEDDYFLLRLYTKTLRAAGYDIEPSLSVEIALEVFGYEDFDLIISDLRVGTFDVEKLIKRLQRLLEARQVPILVISAHMDMYEAQCRSAGLQYLLPKPFSNQALREKVAEILRYN